MLADPGPKGKPLKDALFETLCAKEAAVKASIPRYIKKSLGMLRRKANEVRKEREAELLPDVC